MSPSAPMRSLADDIRSRDAKQIAALLASRPDLTQPWPADLSQLARRAADDSSVLEAMQGLDSTQLRVLEVYAALHEARAEEVAAGLPETEDEVAAAVDHLWTMGLLWCRSRPRIVRAAQQAFGAYPCGLVAAGHAEPDPEQVRAAALELDPEDLADLVWTNPVREHANDLLVTHAGGYALTREASLILRDGAFLPAAGPPPELVQGDAAAPDLLWVPVAGVRYLLTHLAVNPLAWSANRGVSRRAVSDRAEQMAVPPEDLMGWLELAVAAELVGPLNGALYPTTAAAEWLRDPPARMWTALIRAWLASERLLPMCRPEEDGCATTVGRPRVSFNRRHILQVWPAGRLDAQELAEVVAWYRPRMHAAVQQAPDVFAEATVLGLVQAGAATQALMLLPSELESAAAQVPAAAGQPCLILQPDHTIIAPANVDTDTWQLLNEVAVVESWGPVTMHRIDPSRLRSAVTGRGAEEVLKRLRTASRTPLPQSLEYLVGDAARASSANVYPALVIEVTEADVQTVADLGFRQVGPQTFTSDLPDDVVRRRLEQAGVVCAQRSQPLLAEAMEYPHADPPPDRQTMARLVGHLVRDPEGVAGEPPALTPADPRTMAGVCQKAIDSGSRLWLQYADGSQTVIDLVEPLELRSGRVTGWSLSAGRTVAVPLARIAAFGGGS